jgi:regulator of replication initiation timing
VQTLTVEQLLIEISHLNNTIRSLIKEITEVKNTIDDKNETIMQLEKENIRLKLNSKQMRYDP